MNISFYSLPTVTSFTIKILMVFTDDNNEEHVFQIKDTETGRIFFSYLCRGDDTCTELSLSSTVPIHMTNKIKNMFLYSFEQILDLYTGRQNTNTGVCQSKDYMFTLAVSKYPIHYTFFKNVFSSLKKKSLPSSSTPLFTRTGTQVYTPKNKSYILTRT